MREPRTATEALYAQDLKRLQGQEQQAKAERRNSSPFRDAIKKLTTEQLRHEVAKQAAKIQK